MGLLRNNTVADLIVELVQLFAILWTITVKIVTLCRGVFKSPSETTHETTGDSSKTQTIQHVECDSRL